MQPRFWCYSSNDIFPIECCFCRITSAGIIIRHNIEAESKKNDTRVFRNYIKKGFFCCSTLRGLLPPKNLKRSCNLRQLDYENMIFFASDTQQQTSKFHFLRVRTRQSFWHGATQPLCKPIECKYASFIVVFRQNMVRIIIVVARAILKEKKMSKLRF